MATQGPLYASAVTADGTGFGVSEAVWSNLTNVEAADSAYATCTTDHTLTASTRPIALTGFGFSVPTGSTINGVTVEVNRFANGNSFPIGAQDQIVQLIKGGTASGNNKSSVSGYPTSATTVTYGSSSDLWGLTLTSGDINASTFGVKFQAQQSFSGDVTTSVDYIRITVTYTAPNSATLTNISSISNIQTITI